MMRRSSKEFHAASRRLFEHAAVVLADALKRHRLELLPPLDRHQSDEYEGIGEYGCFIINEQGKAFPHVVTFGLGWDLSSGEEVQFVFRWRRERRGITVIESHDLLDFDRLIALLLEELTEA